jgi:triacylglycerol esterase/lipase EstA (alpha/beta hydrolase family)
MRALVFCCAFALAFALAPTARAAEPSTAGTWQPPVDGAVVRPFDAPASVYAPGHRGVDFAAPPGTPVHAANDGVVAFAGDVAGSLHVTVAHDGMLRTSYSFLRDVSVHAGQTVRHGDVVGTTGGTGTDHDGTVLHFGVRVGDRYVDPMGLFRPVDLAALVHLVPVGAPDEQPWTSASERRELQLSLHLPLPATAAAAGDDRGCGGDIPIVGDAVSAACDVGQWVGERAGDASDAGLRVLDAVTAVPTVVLQGLRSPLRDVAERLRAVPGELASQLARTPLGMLTLDVIEMGRRFVGAVTAQCSDDAPPADGSGGSSHRVMVVAGIDSSGAAGDRGSTVRLDVRALGYRAGKGEVRYYSYADDGGPYRAVDTQQPIDTSASLLGDQLRAMQREEPGREVDLVAHSQGGLVVDVFLERYYDPADATLPPIGTVVTLSSPHEGAPLATTGSRIREAPLGRALLDEVGREVSSMPDPSSAAVEDLAEGSATVRDVQHSKVPDHVDLTSIGATEDVVVPATNISLPGATETTVAVNSVNEHSAIVRDPNALRAVRAALEGRPPPCVGFVTALRGAVVPVVVRRESHLLGDAAEALLGTG